MRYVIEIPAIFEKAGNAIRDDIVTANRARANTTASYPPPNIAAIRRRRSAADTAEDDDGSGEAFSCWRSKDAR
jgi:hypothetical protein